MTVLIPEFQLAKTTHTGTVSLKVADLDQMTHFYQKTIGLTLFKQTTTVSVLGTGTTPLLRLKRVMDPLPATTRTGLFHVAFLLPDRKALGNALFHYLTVDAPLVGASDHGYSEALYLNDPEGNGIEVYRDKPMAQWDIREDGEIVGITMEMDAEGVLAEADRQWRGFPEATTVGHVHLKVADLEKTELFYTKFLGLSLKNNYGTQAKFFATGDYHHHIGSNIWMGKDVPAMEAQDLGLEYYTFFVKDGQELQHLEAHWNQLDLTYKKVDSSSLWLKDPNGIQIRFQIEQATQIVN